MATIVKGEIKASVGSWTSYMLKTLFTLDGFQSFIAAYSKATDSGFIDRFDKDQNHLALIYNDFCIEAISEIDPSYNFLNGLRKFCSIDKMPGTISARNFSSDSEEFRNCILKKLAFIIYSMGFDGIELPDGIYLEEENKRIIENRKIALEINDKYDSQDKNEPPSDDDPGEEVIDIGEMTKDQLKTEIIYLKKIINGFGGAISKLEERGNLLAKLLKEEKTKAKNNALSDETSAKPQTEIADLMLELEKTKKENEDQIKKIKTLEEKLELAQKILEALTLAKEEIEKMKKKLKQAEDEIDRLVSENLKLAQEKQSLETGLVKKDLQNLQFPLKIVSERMPFGTLTLEICEKDTRSVESIPNISFTKEVVEEKETKNVSCNLTITI